LSGSRRDLAGERPTVSDPGWAIEVDPPVLLPGQPVRVAITWTPDRDLDARGVHAMLRCTE